jgi:hypothetical protein
MILRLFNLLLRPAYSDDVIKLFRQLLIPVPFVEVHCQCSVLARLTFVYDSGLNLWQGVS